MTDANSAQPEDNLPEEELAFEEAPFAESEEAAGNCREAQNELDQLKGDIEDANSRILRAQAELDNYRKRVQRDNQQQSRYAAQPILKDLLPLIDNMNRALEAASSVESPEGQGLVEGFQMVADELLRVLANHKCVRIEAEGQPFDPNFHEAILQQPSPDHEPGTIIMQTQAGYKLHDRVVRPSQVIVASAPAE
jgi:molecular chaperone GrpE